MDLRTDREKGRRAINERRVGTITWMISQGAPNLCHNCPERLSESDCGLFAQSGCHHHGLLLHGPSPPASPSSGSNRSTGSATPFAGVVGASRTRAISQLGQWPGEVRFTVGMHRAALALWRPPSG